MADFEVTCPHCNQSFDCSEEVGGKNVECPACHGTMAIPKIARPVSVPPPVPSATVTWRQGSPNNGTINVEIQRGVNPLGVAALVIGICACLICWIPFLGLVAIPAGIIGLILAGVGLVMALVSKKTGVVFPLGGGVACFISIFISIAATGGCAKVVSDAIDHSKRTNQNVVGNTPPVATAPTFPSAGSSASEVAPTAVAAPSPVVPESTAMSAVSTEPEPTTEGKGAEWASATSAVRQGEIEIQVTGCGVAKIPLKDMFGKTGQSKDSHLWIGIAVRNLSAGKKVDFSTWRGLDFIASRSSATLSDDNENHYRGVSFGVADHPVGINEDQESLYPGKSTQDVLIFEVPVSNIRWLHLELPASNFGGTGKLRFEIPASMITRVQSTGAVAAPGVAKPMATAANGVRSVAVHSRRCENCLGTGKFEIPYNCPACKGQGQITKTTEMHVACGRCAGFGRARGNDNFPCSKCDGRGYVVGKRQTKSFCMQCHGSGSLNRVEACPVCRGTGKEGGVGKNVSVVPQEKTSQGRAASLRAALGAAPRTPPAGFPGMPPGMMPQR